MDKYKTDSNFLNNLFNLLDQAKFMASQEDNQLAHGTSWPLETYKEVCSAWKGLVIELCEIFAKLN